MEKEIELIDAQKAKLAKEGDLITAQIALSGAEKAKIEAETTLLPKQLLKLEKEAELIANQKELALAEKNLTSERIKLVTAQTSAELAKKPLIEREKAVYDDNLRVKEAEIIKDLASGYLIGGVEVPSGLHQAVMNKIDLITDQS